MLAGAGMLCAMSQAQAGAVAIYDFGTATPLVDQTGHFSDLTLVGSPDIINGALHVDGAGATPTQYATANWVSGAATFDSMTLISWVELLSYGASAGSALTLDTVSTDRFNAIVFDERPAQAGDNEWIVGSNNFTRTVPSYAWEAHQPLNQKVQMAYTFEKTNGGTTTQVTGYRDGDLLGTYEINSFEQFELDDGMIFLGARHDHNGNILGAIDALIYRVEIWDGPLTGVEVTETFEAGTGLDAAVPLPAALPLSLAGLAALAAIARRRRG